MRIGWVGISVAARTGYGKVTADILDRLVGRGHEFISIAHSPDVIVWGGEQQMRLPSGKHITTLPISNPLDKRAECASAIQSYTQKFKLDMLFGFWDAFAIEWLPDVGMPWAAYIPVDGEITRPWVNYVNDAMNIAVYSEFGWDQFANSGMLPISKLSRIDHGVDTRTFIPLGIEKGKLRRHIKAAPPIPEECFLLISVAANYGDRKKIPLLLETFREFSKEHDDAHLYLSTNPYAKFTGYNLPILVDMLGITGKVHFPTYNPIMMATPDSYLNKLYNAADIYITASCAEGFGMPLLEAASAGIPAIAPRNSSQQELVEGHGWLADNVSEDAYTDWPSYVPQLTKYPVCDKRSLLEQMERAYMNHAEREHYGIEARNFAMRYDWSHIIPQWERLLDSLEDELRLTQSAVG